MAEYDYAGDPTTFPTPKANTNGSSSGTFWDNSWKKLVDRTAYLQDQLLGATNGLAGKLASLVTSSSGARLVGAEAHTGANGQGNYAAQTLFALLGAIWDGKGGLAAANPWSGAQTLTSAGSYVFQGPVARSGAAATFAGRVVAENPAGSTATINTDYDAYFVESPTFVGHTVYTLKSSSPTPPVGAEIELTCLNLTSTHDFDLAREDASTIVTINGGSNVSVWARLKFFTLVGAGAPAWHIVAGGPVSGSTNWTLGTT